jgi:hypothetical protein
MKYNCVYCNYLTQYSSNFKKHLKTKKHLLNNDKGNVCSKIKNVYKTTPLLPQNDPFLPQNDPFLTLNDPLLTQKKQVLIKKAYICKLCKKSFSKNSHLNRHTHRNCKVYKEKMVLEELELIKDNKKDKQIEILQKTVNKLMDKVGNTTINNNQVNNNVQLNCFGKENLEMVTDDIKKEMIKGPFKMMPKLLELIYFNKKYPENHTMKLVNKNKELMKIHKKKGWEFVDKQDTIDYLLEDKNYTLDSYYDDNTVIFSKMIKKTYNNFRSLFDNRDKELWKQIKRDVDLLLWNNM